MALSDIYYNGTCGNLDVDLRTYYRLFSIMVHVSKLIGCRFKVMAEVDNLDKSMRF